MEKMLKIIAPFPLSPDYGSSTRVINEIMSVRSLFPRIKVLSYGIYGSYTKIIRDQLNLKLATNLFKMGFSLQHLIPSTTLYLRALIGKDVEYRSDSIIHAHWPIGGLIGLGLNATKLRDSPVICDLHGLVFEEAVMAKQKELARLVFLIEKLVLDKVDFVITSNELLAREVLKRYQIERRKMAVVYDAVDVNRFITIPKELPLMWRKIYNIPTDALVILYVGSISKLQGMDLMLKFLTEIMGVKKNVYFVIVGGKWSKEYASLITQIKNYPQDIKKFIRLIPRADYLSEVPIIVNAADICISLKRPSLQSNAKLLIYGAAGKPVITFDTKINRIFLGPYGIYLTWPLQSDEFLQAVEKAIDYSCNEDYRIGLTNYIKKNHSLDRLREQLVHVYESFCT